MNRNNRFGLTLLLSTIALTLISANYDGAQFYFMGFAVLVGGLCLIGSESKEDK